MSKLHITAALVLSVAMAVVPFAGAGAQDTTPGASAPKAKPAAEVDGTSKGGGAPKDAAMTKKGGAKVKKAGAMSGAVEK